MAMSESLKCGFVSPCEWQEAAWLLAGGRWPKRLIAWLANWKKFCLDAVGSSVARLPCLPCPFGNGAVDVCATSARERNLYALTKGCNVRSR